VATNWNRHSSLELIDMANLAINALTAKTPVSTDLIPVADPTTGIAGKSTIQQSYNANIQAVSIEYTGAAPPPYGAMVTPTFGTQLPSGLTIQTGVAVETLSYNNGLSTTLTFSNLTVIRSAVSVTNWPSLTSLSFPSLNSIVNAFSPGTMPLLTTLSSPLLSYIGNNYQPSIMAALTTLSTPALAYIVGSYSPATMASLTTLSIPALSYVGSSFSPNTMGALTTLSAPALAIVAGGFSPATMGLLTTLSIPALSFVGANFNPSAMASLTTISAPALISVGADLGRTVFNVGQITLPGGMTALTSLTFPAIEVIGAASSISINIVSGSAALSTFTLGSTLRRVEGNVIMTSCALTQASVDSILVRLAALDGTGLTTAYSSKTVTLTGTSATPSATGLAAKSTLVARGCTVTNN
jgi:hypothetical protein